MERKLTAILAPDVVGYSRLMEADEGATIRMLDTYRQVTFQLADVSVPKELFRKILSLIDDLRPRPAPA